MITTWGWFKAYLKSQCIYLSLVQLLLPARLSFCKILGFRKRCSMESQALDDLYQNAVYPIIMDWRCPPHCVGRQWSTQCPLEAHFDSSPLSLQYLSLLWFGRMPHVVHMSWGMDKNQCNSIQIPWRDSNQNALPSHRTVYWCLSLQLVVPKLHISLTSTFMLALVLDFSGPTVLGAWYTRNAQSNAHNAHCSVSAKKMYTMLPPRVFSWSGLSIVLSQLVFLRYPCP